MQTSQTKGYIYYLQKRWVEAFSFSTAMQHNECSIYFSKSAFSTDVLVFKIPPTENLTQRQEAHEGGGGFTFWGRQCEITTHLR